MPTGRASSSSPTTPPPTSASRSGRPTARRSRSSATTARRSTWSTPTARASATHRGVTWSITGCSGGLAVCGGLTNVTSTQATYTAPATVPPGTLGVTATSISDNSESLTARVAITAIAAADQIAFLSTRDGSLYSIYLMNADGSAPRSPTNQPASCLSWSPDGSKIAFGSYVAGGTYDLYMMNADGSGLRNLTNGVGCDPAWSPRGQRPGFCGRGHLSGSRAAGAGLDSLRDHAGFLAGSRGCWPDRSMGAF